MNWPTHFPSRFVVGILVFALVATNASKPIQADEANPESSAAAPEQWITGLATAGEKLYASTAQGLLLREASVVTVDPSSPARTTVAYQHPTGVWDIVATPDGGRVASVDYKGNLVVFDVAAAEPTLHEGAFKRWCQALLADDEGESIVAGNEAGEVLVWDLESAKVTKTQTLDGHAISDLAWAPDGKSLAATDGDGHAHLLKWPSLEIIGEVHLGDEPAWCIAFVDDKTCLVGSGDRNLYQVNVSDFVIPEPQTDAAAEKASEPADKKDDDEKDDDEKSDENEERKPESKPAPQIDGVACYQAKDWITQIDINASGEIAIGEIGGGVHVLQIDEDGNAKQTDKLDSPSGVWALNWQDNQLLIGTRKNGLRAATRAWKWLDE